MFYRKLAVISLLIIPATLSAQRKTRGDADASKTWDAIDKANAGGLKLSNKDVEGTSPIKELLDKKKDLKLSEDQVKKLKEFESRDKEKNKDLYKALDSLRMDVKPGAAGPSDADMIRIELAKSVVTNVVKEIRANYDATLTEAIPVLDESQQKTAKELIDKQRKESEEMLREKLGGRGGGGGGGRRPLGA